MTQTLTLPATIQRMKSEILADIAAGVVPATVASFSELHDYVDANMYGGGGNLDVDSEEFSAFCDMLNDAQNAIDAWIKEGRPV